MKIGDTITINHLEYVVMAFNEFQVCLFNPDGETFTKYLWELDFN